MKILLIGHSIVDYLSNADNEIIKPGGIFYSLLGMIPFADKDDEIYMITGVQKEFTHLFNPVYSLVKEDFVSEISDMPQVHLTVFKNKERREIYKNLGQSLKLNKVTDFSFFDAVLVNMITGFDITFTDLQFIRKQFNGPVYFDVHTLSRGLNPNMERIFRPVPQIEKWLENVNIVQANEFEILTISDKKTEADRAFDVLSMGPEMLIITRGDEGAGLYVKSGVEIKYFSVPAIGIKAVNKVGCGDIFGAVFFYSYIHKRDYYESLKLANKAAGISTAYYNQNEYFNLKKDANKRPD